LPSVCGTPDAKPLGFDEVVLLMLRVSKRYFEVASQRERGPHIDMPLATTTKGLVALHNDEAAFQNP